MPFSLDPKVQTAKSLLKDADIDKIICIYLSSNNAAIDWNQVKQYLGSSRDAFKIKYDCKKALEAFEKSCRNGEENSCETFPEGSVPKSRVVKRGGKRKAKKAKSKAKVEESEESEDLRFDNIEDEFQNAMI